MHRSQIYDQSDVRSYDHLMAWREALFATSSLVAAILGQTTTVVSGLGATATGPTSLVVNIAAGQIYQLAAVDSTAFGDLLADATQVLQQGFAPAQTVTLTTTGLSSGKSRWALIQATFSQVDDIPSDDPNGGLLPFVNPSNPSGPPWSGPGNAGTTLNTRRKGVCTVSVIYGSVANTGTEVPPSASAGAVGLYLIDLAFGQTAVSNGQIKVAGPSVGTGVPSNYPVAPFLSGLLNSHHNGLAGQATKINLATETQGLLPAASVAGFGSLPGVRNVAVSTTFTSADSGYLLRLQTITAGASTFTMPVPVSGMQNPLCNDSAFPLTVTVDGSTPYFYGLTTGGAFQPGQTASFVLPSQTTAHIESDGAGNWLVDYNSGSSQGNLASFTTYTTGQTFTSADFGSGKRYGQTATGTGTFTFAVPTNGAVEAAGNDSAFALTLNATGGGNVFYGQLGPTGWTTLTNAVSSFNLPPGSYVRMEGTNGGAWLVTFNTTASPNAGNYTVIADAGYEITTNDMGSYILFGTGGTANRTFLIDDGTIPNQTVRISCLSTIHQITVQPKAGSVANFFGMVGGAAGVSSFVLAGQQEVTLVWTGSNWHSPYFSPAFDLAGSVTTFNGIGSLALVQTGSALTTGTSYAGSTFTGFGLSGTWKCITSGGTGGVFFSLITRTA